MKEFHIKITKRSTNAKKELDNYVYAQDKEGKFINEPVDEWNHIMDLTRYVILSEVIGKNRKKMNIHDLSGYL